MPFKPLTNIVYQVKFNFDQPKVWDNTDKDGKAYKSFSYGVEIEGKNEYFNVSEAVHKMLQSFGPLSARTLEIQKVQDPNDLKKIHWIFKENGVELRPSQSPTPVQSQTPAVAQNTASQGHSSCNERLDKASKAFALLRTEFSDLQDKFKSLEILVEEVAGKQATDLHLSLKNRDITEPKTPSLEDAAKIVDSYKSDPTIPTINEVPKDFDA